MILLWYKVWSMRSGCTHNGCWHADRSVRFGLWSRWRRKTFFEMQPWTGLMHTQLFARLADSRHVEKLTGTLSLPPDPPCGSLRPGKEYALPEGDHWLRFWIPEKGSGGFK